MKKKSYKRLWSAVSSSLAATDKMLSTRLTIIALLAATGFWTSDGLYYDVACPGVNSELQCPEGKLIRVKSTQTGHKSSADCQKRNESATAFDDDVIYWGMKAFNKKICNGLQRCRLPKPNQKFLLRRNTEDNFIQIDYECYEKNPDMKTVVACEGETAQLGCALVTETISIVKARYGRFDENICNPGNPSTMTFCSSYEANDFVIQKCHGEKQCSVKSDTDDLGDAAFCDDEPKYLTVDYLCV
ncbi:rhamnose-binding lectin-like [Sebastes umbrosus]|uniref:rhamnose-binding lectin-like n=1 Tax=Sebastes umbrosus TaxID=72105 RepID=UPI00189F3A0C|nr:rhamnose-binding lectin-like [Sebastes umbrosus]